MKDFQVIVSRKYRRITMQRFLVSKLLFEYENFRAEDLLALFTNQLFLEDLAAKDPSFRKKFSDPLEEISRYLKAARFQKPQDIPRITEKFKKFIKIKLTNFHYPKRNFKEQEKLYKRFVEFRERKPEGTPLAQLPAVQYIGIGYSDKGTAKIPHLDGSPRWQDVASRRSHKNA